MSPIMKVAIFATFMALGSALVAAGLGLPHAPAIAGGVSTFFLLTWMGRGGWRNR